MKKLHPLLSVLFLIYWGCEDTKKEDNIPTQVTLWGVDYSIENTTTLSLSYDQLTGPIPPEIGNLVNLERLYLDNNQLTGPIPPEIGNLINLEYLTLDNNQLIGQIPLELGDLFNLNTLNLSQNQLSGINPEIICNVYEIIPDWGLIDIGYNQLCPPYPSCVEDYVGLQNVCSCGLNDDEVVQLWDNCYFIETTTELNLSDNGLVGEIPSEIGNLINLESLNLTYNQLTGEIPDISS